MTIYKGMGDRLIGERIVVSYQDWTPKSGYRIAKDGTNRKEMTLCKSVCCTIEKPIKKT